jgi:hypothetical protein
MAKWELERTGKNKKIILILSLCRVPYALRPKALFLEMPLGSDLARETRSNLCTSYSHLGTEKKVLWIALTALCRSLVLTRK